MSNTLKIHLIFTVFDHPLVSWGISPSFHRGLVVLTRGGCVGWLLVTANKSPFDDDSDSEEEDWVASNVSLPKPHVPQQANTAVAPQNSPAEPFFKTLEKSPFQDLIKEEDDDENDEDSFISAPMPTAPVVYHSNCTVRFSLFVQDVTLLWNHT